MTNRRGEFNNTLNRKAESAFCENHTIIKMRPEEQANENEM